MNVSRSRAGPALAAALALSGCASAATVAGMTAPTWESANRALARSIAVQQVTGGTETDRAWGSSKIDNPSFQAALAASLRGAGLLAEGAAARYLLTAEIVALNQPASGFDMTVTLVVQYRLADAASGAVLLDEEISAAHTATMGDTVLGVERLQLANEGAARRNITALIRRLDVLRLPPAAVAPASS